MEKLNCWQVSGCGRETGGHKVGELGICPASAHEASHGLNQGRNGGRICWTVAGTLCKGEVQGSQAQKEVTCLTCDFFKRVKSEEGGGFQIFASMKATATV